MAINASVVVQFFKFGIVGFSNTLVSYLVYAALVYLNMPYLLASVFSFVVGVVNSYIWNSRFVFKCGATNKLDALKIVGKTFFLYAFTGLVISNLLLVLLVEKFGFDKYVSKLFTLAVTVPLNFLLSKFWAYREKERNKEIKYENRITE